MKASKPLIAGELAQVQKALEWYVERSLNIVHAGLSSIEHGQAIGDTSHWMCRQLHERFADTLGMLDMVFPEQAVKPDHTIPAPDVAPPVEPRRKDPYAKVANWNRLYVPGLPVRVMYDTEAECNSETRTIAFVSMEHEPVVWVNGFSKPVHLDALAIASDVRSGYRGIRRAI